MVLPGVGAQDAISLTPRLDRITMLERPEGACGTRRAPVGCFVRGAVPGAGVARSATRDARGRATPVRRVVRISPVVGKQPGHGYPEGVGDGPEPVDGHGGLAVFDALECAALHPGLVGKYILRQLLFPSQTSDTITNLAAPAQRSGIGWFCLRHLINAGVIMRECMQRRSGGFSIKAVLRFIADGTTVDRMFELVA